MHLQLLYASFPCCSRADLESLQLTSKLLRGTIARHSSALPLRPIDSVNFVSTVFQDTIKICIDEDAAKPDYEATSRDGDFAETFRRLQNSCIKEFWGTFHDGPFLRSLEAQEATAFVVVAFRFVPPCAEERYAFDSFVHHLRPKSAVFNTGDDNGNDDLEEGLALMARDSFLSSLKICCLSVYGAAFSPAALVFKEPGYANYELCWEDASAADAIDGFVESFVRDGSANSKLESVCMRWKDDGEPQSRASKLLSKPTKIDKSLPEIELTEALAGRLVISDLQVSQCETYSFVNLTQWKQMDVFKWTVEYDLAGRRKEHILQCQLKNL